MMRYFSLLLLFLFITACSTNYVHDRRKDYLHAQNGPELVIPQGFSSKKISNDYIIEKPVGNTGVSMLPPGSYTEQVAHQKAQAKKS